MIITDEMKKQDELFWNNRKIKSEIEYCGNNIKHRKSITNKDLRFYAYVFRCALKRINELETQLSEGGYHDGTGSKSCNQRRSKR